MLDVFLIIPICNLGSSSSPTNILNNQVRFFPLLNWCRVSAINSTLGLERCVNLDSVPKPSNPRGCYAVPKTSRLRVQIFFSGSIGKKNNWNSNDHQGLHDWWDFTHAGILGPEIFFRHHFVWSYPPKTNMAVKNHNF